MTWNVRALVQGRAVEPRCIGFRYANGKVSGEDKEDAIWSSRAPAEERQAAIPLDANRRRCHPIQPISLLPP